MSPPRLLLMIITPSFILAIVSRFIMSALSFVSGVCSEITSERLKSSSSSTYSAIFAPSSLRLRL